jgi:hypothetical protein
MTTMGICAARPLRAGSTTVRHNVGRRTSDLAHKYGRILPATFRQASAGLIRRVAYAGFAPEVRLSKGKAPAWRAGCSAAAVTIQQGQKARNSTQAANVPSPLPHGYADVEPQSSTPLGLAMYSGVRCIRTLDRDTESSSLEVIHRTRHTAQWITLPRLGTDPNFNATDM